MEPADKPLASDAVAAGGLQWPPPVAEGDILWLDADRVADVDPPSTNTVSLSHLSLSRLLALSGMLEWHDAIAVILGVADALKTSAGGGPAAVPSSDAILLESDGHFRITTASGSQRPLVSGLGALLNRLLRDKPLPVKLRLFASVLDSETANTMSAHEFLGELARWERPGRQQKLADLYERARSQKVEPPQESVPPAVDDPRPAPAPAQESPSVAPRPRRVTPVMIVTAGVSVVLVVVALTWSIARRHPAAGLPDSRVAAPLADAASPSSGGAGIEADAHPRGARSHAGSQWSRRPNATNHQPSAAIERGSTQETYMADAPQTPEGSAERTPIPPVTVATGPSRLAIVEPLRSPLLPVEPIDPERVYHAGDAGVTPASLVRPHLPRRARPDIPESALGFLEIVVDSSGRVESVRLQSPANRYREKWWLFAAKDWQFAPATKNGRAVRFLARIPLTDLNPSEPQ